MAHLSFWTLCHRGGMTYCPGQYSALLFMDVVSYYAYDINSNDIRVRNYIRDFVTHSPAS